MSIAEYISSVIKTCFLQLREFRHIRSFISKSAAITFANAFIYSRIDCCNSLLHGLSKYSLHRLQKVQNSFAHFVTRTSRSSNITPLLLFSNLYIGYLLNTALTLNCDVTHRALSLRKSHYLNSLLNSRLNPHCLRSSSFNTLMLPFFNLMSNGFRSFAFAAPFL